MLFCALDTNDLSILESINLLIKNRDTKTGHAPLGIKLGYQFLFQHGLESVLSIDKDIPVFVDLKLHDIPNTVHQGIKNILGQLKDHKQLFITVHIAGGEAMVKSALEAAKDSNASILGVTLLTSLNKEDAQKVSVGEDAILKRAELAINCGIDGLVSSGQEVSKLRKMFPGSFLVVPGVKFGQDNVATDQKRTISARDAMSLGASAIVAGRSILRHISTESENATAQQKNLEHAILAMTREMLPL